MGIFGRSNADQALIDRQAGEIRRLNAIISEAFFRDPVTGRWGAKGKVPARLKGED